MSEQYKYKLPRLIAALLDPSVYPHPTRRIELRQTHISYVILTGDYVYKIKKPVNFGFLDYSTLDKRYFFCREEVRLNRRLCPEIYLGVVEIGETAGRIALGRGERLLEYAVQMRQLPEERMLDRLLACNIVDEGMVVRLAERLVQFYAQARAGPEVERYGDVRWLITNAQENFAQTAPYISRTISPETYQLVKEYTERTLANQRSVFEQRVLEGHIREGHGDLRPESICYTDGICIFDCVEFNERFRCLDVACDIAFLLMELDKIHRFDLSCCFLDAYIRLTGDTKARDVLRYYKVYRAFVRGKVESFKLDEPEMPDTEKRRSCALAREYFDLARFYITHN